MNERTITSRSGHDLVVRPMTVDDDELVVTAFQHLSPRTAVRRFFSPTILKLGRERLAEFVGLRPGHRALLAFDRQGGLVGGVRTITDPADPTTAEIAVTVGDRAQGDGIGAQLFDLGVEDARRRGIGRLRGHVQVDNLPARRLVARAGGQSWPHEPGILAFEIVLDPDLLVSPDAIERTLLSA